VLWSMEKILAFWAKIFAKGILAKKPKNAKAEKKRGGLLFSFAVGGYGTDGVEPPNANEGTLKHSLFSFKNFYIQIIVCLKISNLKKIQKLFLKKKKKIQKLFLKKFH